MAVPVGNVPLNLGRAEDNDVILVADEVSRHHAQIIRRGDDSVLLDLQSLNGTYVNRERVIECVLGHMDEIWLGSKCRLVYRDDTGLGGPTALAISDHDSTLAQAPVSIDDLDKIRENMNRAGSSLTFIAKRGDTPTPAPARRAMADTDITQMGHAYRRLEALYKASSLLASEPDLEERLSRVLDTAIEITEAERGFILLKEEIAKPSLGAPIDATGVFAANNPTGGRANRGLRVCVARAMGQELQASSPSMGIAGRAAIDAEPVLMADRERDEQYGGRESIIQQRISSAMAVPLIVPAREASTVPPEGQTPLPRTSAPDRVLGSIYVDTRRAGRMFSNEDLELFASLAAQSAMAIDNTRLHQQMLETEHKRASLARFLSPPIVEKIMREDAVLQLGGSKQIVTTMFCDIRTFTQIAEQTAPADLVDLLNEHFTAMTQIIFEYQGTLDKFIGDEVMALFGAPFDAPDDALRAVKAALAMQAATEELNPRRRDEQRPELNIGIGIDTGEVIAGYIGAPERMEFSVVGDRVNTARRLCSLAEPSQIVVGDATYQLVKDHVNARPIGTVILRGKQTPVHAYEIRP